MKAQRSPTVEEIAYLAGIIDGEGYIYILRRKIKKRRDCWSYGVKVKMIDNEAILLLQETFGGYVAIGKPTGRQRTPYFCWHIAHRGAARFLVAISPYLHVKNKQAKLVLDFASLLYSKNQEKGTWHSWLTEKESEARNDIVEAMKIEHHAKRMPQIARLEN